MPDDQQQNNTVPEPAAPAPEPIAPQPADDLAAKLVACEQKRDEYLAGWQRERADFQNYKKDEFKRLTESREAITAAIIEDILPVLDSFDMAFDFVPEEPAAHKWARGVEQVRLQLLDILKRMGVEAVKVEEGKMMFDPALHEAVEEIASDEPEGTILEELQKGYALNGKTLRPARVKVSKLVNPLTR